jgi:hypothetical protein
MGIKRKIFATAAVFACFSIVSAQTAIKIHTAFVAEKIYDGTKEGRLSGIVFAKTDGKFIEPNLKLFDEVSGQGDFKITSVTFDKAGAAEAKTATVKIELVNSLYEFENDEDSITVDATIKKANGYIRIECKDVTVFGAKPNVIIRNMNLADSDSSDWNDESWREANGVYFRFAQMNMLEHNPSEPEKIPAWRKTVPETQGLYWVEAVFEGNDNYNAFITDAESFVISSSAVSMKNYSKRQTTFGFAGISNGEINLTLKTGVYTLEMYNLQGRLIAKRELNAKDGINTTGLKIANLSRGVLILNVKQGGMSVLQHKITVK